jgi:hypothetical protein
MDETSQSASSAPIAAISRRNDIISDETGFRGLQPEWNALWSRAHG